MFEASSAVGRRASSHSNCIASPPAPTPIATMTGWSRPTRLRTCSPDSVAASIAFRYNYRSALGVTDAERAAAALKGTEGKRLTYRRIGEAANV
jgi:hypothetical protein